MTLREKMQPLSIILAVDEYGGFGKDGKIPWYFPEDLKHFKEITTGHPCVMGRKTYEDMLQMRLEREAKKKNTNKVIKEYLTVQNNGEPPPIESLNDAFKEILPNRKSFVVTSNPDFNAPGATVVKSLREAVQSLEPAEQVFVIGGYRMFIEALSWATTIYLTVVKGTYDCDRFFPIEVLNKNYRIVDGTQTDNLYFVTYQRIGR